MRNIVIATLKNWNIKHAERIRERYKGLFNIEIITEKSKLDKANIDK